jgi:hypothetical protein
MPLSTRAIDDRGGYVVVVLVVARERLKQMSKLLIVATPVLVVKQRFELPGP